MKARLGESIDEQTGGNPVKEQRTKAAWIAGISLSLVSPAIFSGCQTARTVATTHATGSTRPIAQAVPPAEPTRVEESPPIHFASFRDDLSENGNNESTGDATPASDTTDAEDSNKIDSATGTAAPTLATDSLDGSPSNLSLETCIQMALAGHPKIAAARFRVQAAMSRVPQASALADPMLNNNFFPIASNAQQTASGRMQNSISLSQQVPWPEKLKAKAAIACREVSIAQAEVASVQREVTESVQLAYYELWFADQGLRILDENQKLVADLIRASEARYRSGGSQQDVVNAEIQRERLTQQQLELLSQRAAAQAELAALLQQPQNLVLNVDPELSLAQLPARLDELVALAEQCNPELRGLGYQIQRDIQKQRLAKLQRYSDLQFSGGYDFMTTGAAISPVADGVDNISFGVGFTLPIYRNKINAGISESAAEIANSARLREAEQLSIAGRLRRLLSEIDALDQQRTLYAERIVPRAEQALEIALSEYTVGKTTFVQLTDNYTELLMYRLQVAKLESTLAARLAQLQRTVGCPHEISN